ncbi:Dehydrogenase/reductase SDR family member 7B [Penicillium macrosclerotiorum]|uniref:Dehydrogenase/reductase SDR family member 7B n=1 Tax=Penicillium macrosclerotiorum TaxID=303699 RepID=UPI002547A447|nr:Dehydrogenase/reductase SDR family member 7B [Penicillium macrosclerotiorum]KAJ5679287.1 Dehydrogenase/reductase SDR family member 7B [Penicillium macrosclerotiorum]
MSRPLTPVRSCQATNRLVDSARFAGSLVGQVALVTGASRGIGRAIAFALANAGAHVVCVARTVQDIWETANEISAQTGIESLAIAADVSILEDIDYALQLIRQKFGRIDILINNAGICRIGPLGCEPDFNAWWRVLEVNLRGPAALIHRVLPEMLHRDRGVIISIGSRNAIHNFPFLTAYSAAKTALLRVHQCLDMEITDSGIRHFYLQPGDVPTSLIDNAVNLEALETIPALQEMINSIQSVFSGPDACSPQVAGDACVVLAADSDSQALSGMYLDVDKLSLHLEQAKKECKSKRI